MEQYDKFKGVQFTLNPGEGILSPFAQSFKQSRHREGVLFGLGEVGHFDLL